MPSTLHLYYIAFTSTIVFDLMRVKCDLKISKNPVNLHATMTKDHVKGALVNAKMKGALVNVMLATTTTTTTIKMTMSNKKLQVQVEEVHLHLRRRVLAQDLQVKEDLQEMEGTPQVEMKASISMEAKDNPSVISALDGMQLKIVLEEGQLVLEIDFQYASIVVGDTNPIYVHLYLRTRPIVQSLLTVESYHSRGYLIEFETSSLKGHGISASGIS